MPTPTRGHPGTPPVFFQIGVEYYVCARAAVRIQQAQVAGNLFHHAFEMMLSGLLLDNKVFTVNDLKAKFGNKHDLRGLWATARRTVPGATRSRAWSRFDRFITDLHNWERIRFGEFPRGLPKSLAIDYRRGADVGAKARRQGFDQYRLCLEDADALFLVLVGEMGKSQGWSQSQRWTLFGSAALDAYEWNNRHLIEGHS